MRKTVKRFLIMFILLFLAMFGLQLVFDGILAQNETTLQMMLSGLGIIVLDILYYFVIYKRFYPME